MGTTLDHSGVEGISHAGGTRTETIAIVVDGSTKGVIMIFYSEAGVRDLLKKACLEHGSQYQFATKHQLSPSYVNDVLTKRRGPGKGILKALRLRLCVHYEEIS